MIYCREGLKGQVANVENCTDTNKVLTLGFQHEM